MCDTTDNRWRHVKRTLHTPRAFGDRIVRNQRVCALRQALKVAVIAVSIATECDADATQVDAISQRGYVTMNDGRGSDADTLSVKEQMQLVRLKDYVMRLEQIGATLGRCHEFGQVTKRTVWGSK
jgi:hypothetical protein